MKQSKFQKNWECFKHQASGIPDFIPYSSRSDVFNKSSTVPKTLFTGKTMLHRETKLFFVSQPKKTFCETAGYWSSLLIRKESFPSG